MKISLLSFSRRILSAIVSGPMMYIFLMGRYLKKNSVFLMTVSISCGIDGITAEISEHDCACRVVSCRVNYGRIFHFVKTPFMDLLRNIVTYFHKYTLRRQPINTLIHLSQNTSA